jgi:uncharacterized protein
MDIFAEFIKQINDPKHRDRTVDVLNWVNQKYPNLQPVIKWNQPMFIDHGTYIIGFSLSKQHISVAPEQAGINQFTDAIEQAGYDHTKEIIRIKWNQSVEYSLLENLIEFNISDKADCQTFWR